MKTIRKIIFTRYFGISVIILTGLFGFSIFLEYDQGIFLPITMMINDMIVEYNESIRKSNYDASNILDCNDVDNPYNEYECFRYAFSSCYAAVVNPEIYIIEGYPIYMALKITSDCFVKGISDTGTDRFTLSEFIISECKSLGRGDYEWSVGSCDADNIEEMEFNFEMQL